MISSSVKFSNARKKKLLMTMMRELSKAFLIIRYMLCFEKPAKCFRLSLLYFFVGAGEQQAAGGMGKLLIEATDKIYVREKHMCDKE